MECICMNEKSEKSDSSSENRVTLQTLIQRSYKKYRPVFTKKPSYLQIYKEDKRLANYKKWMRIRQKQHRFLSRATNRQPEELVLNSAEKYHSFSEIKKKMYIVSSQFDTHPDKLRILEPGFWRTYEFLAERTLPGESNPEPAPVPVPQLEKERKPKFEVPLRCAIPDIVLEEKNLKNIDKAKTHWKRSSYLKYKIEKAPREIVTAVFAKPYRNKISSKKYIEEKGLKSLVIIGEKPPTLTEIPVEDPQVDEKSDDPLIEDGPVEDSPIEETNGTICECTVALKIQVTQNNNEESVSGGETMRNLFFTNKPKENRNKITLENTGTLEISYNWREILLSSKQKEANQSSTFFFNKKPGSISPGEKKCIPAYFMDSNMSEHPRIVVEFWVLETQPDPTIRCVFSFWGMSQQEVKKPKTEPIVCRQQDDEDRDKIIEEIVEELCLKAYDVYETNVPPEPPYQTFFVEKELFEAFNRGFHYHRDCMIQLENINSQISTTFWDLSLRNLKSKIMNCTQDDDRESVLAEFYGICRTMFSPSSTIVGKNVICFNPIIENFFNCFEYEDKFVQEHCYTGLGDIGEFEEEPDEENFVSLKKETFYLRIFVRLGETIEKLCAAVDSARSLESEYCSYLDKSMIYEKGRKRRVVRQGHE